MKTARYHVVMWSLDSSLGLRSSVRPKRARQLDDIHPDISYGALKSLLEVWRPVPFELGRSLIRQGSMQKRQREPHIDLIP